MKPLRQPNCSRCGDTGKAERTATIDHILTDTQPWGYCGCAAGSALRNGISMDPIPQADLQRASRFLRREGLVGE